MTQAEEHEKLQAMTPREREMAAKLAELEKFRESAAEKEAREAEAREQAEYEAQSGQISDYIAGKLVAALKAADVSPEHAVDLVPRAFDLMSKARQGGYKLEDDEIAAALVEEREERSWGHVLKAGPEGVVKKFQASGTLKDLAKAVAVALRAGNGPAAETLEPRAPAAKPVAPDDFAAPVPKVKKAW